MRTTLARRLAPVLLAVAAGGLLTACGGDDSASSTPSFTSPAATTTSAASTTESESESETTESTTTSPGAAATNPEEQEAEVPEGFPGPAALPLDERGTRFLDELRERDVTVAGNGEIAISTANYICAAQREGLPGDQVLTFVTANVGAEASATGTEISAEDATQTAQTYIDVASSTYCG